MLVLILGLYEVNEGERLCTCIFLLGVLILGLYEVNEGERSCTCIFLLGVLILPVSIFFFIRFYNCSDSVVFIVSFYYQLFIRSPTENEK